MMVICYASDVIKYDWRTSELSNATTPHYTRSQQFKEKDPWILDLPATSSLRLSEAGSGLAETALAAPLNVISDKWQGW